MEEKNELATTRSELQQVPKSNNMGYTNVFGSKDLFEHTQRVAVMFSKSDLVPKQFQNNVSNCIIALEISARIGASPLMIMQK